MKNILIKTIVDDKIIDTKEQFYEDKEFYITINDSIEIYFLCMDNDLESLVYGYMSEIPPKRFRRIQKNNNRITIHIDLSKDEILEALRDKNIIQTCESIQITEKKANRDNVIIPFNGSRTKIHINTLREWSVDFYNQIIDSPLSWARILDLHTKSFYQSFDTNPKNALYKTIGLMIQNQGNLLYSMIFLNDKLGIELLKKIILSQITFLVVPYMPSFSTIKIAQKFGLTLIWYDKGAIKILTHSSRISLLDYKSRL